MKLIKIFSLGKIIDKPLYIRLKVLDARVFYQCDNEFKKNREWWVILNRKKEIIAYCGSVYSEGVCIFIRAWVYQPFRGKGIQRQMIRERIRSAKKYCKVAITYTFPSNIHSANNLIKSNFTLYKPGYKWAGNTQLYFRKEL